MPLTSRFKRYLRQWFAILFWGIILFLAGTLGLAALLSSQVRFSRINTAPQAQKK